MHTLIICSKSRWSPAIRREQALARMAARRGHRVLFVEQPRDVRALARAGRRDWLQMLAGRSETRRVAEGIEVLPRVTILPPHRGRLGIGLEKALLRRAIARRGAEGATVVATTPWQWPAVAELHGVRRVFDCGDDWSALIPPSRASSDEQYRRIAAEADAVIVVNGRRLSRLFGSRSVVVVPNGTSEEVLATPPSPPPEAPVITYAGTLSERFDASLVAGVLERLAGWRMDIYGECRYSGRGDRPAPELLELLASFPGRVAWHGPVGRAELAGRLDAARVCVLPHRNHGAVTGDDLKVYDYAARGRPIVSTSWRMSVSEDSPPGLYLADTAAAFAQLVRSSAHESSDMARQRRAWAEARTWEHRWPSWAAAVFALQ